MPITIIVKGDRRLCHQIKILIHMFILNIMITLVFRGVRIHIFLNVSVKKLNFKMETIFDSMITKYVSLVQSSMQTLMPFSSV